MKNLLLVVMLLFVFDASWAQQTNENTEKQENKISITINGKELSEEDIAKLTEGLRLKSLEDLSDLDEIITDEQILKLKELKGLTIPLEELEKLKDLKINIDGDNFTKDLHILWDKEKLENEVSKSFNCHNYISNYDPDQANQSTSNAPNKAVLGVMLDNAGGNNGAKITDVFEGSSAEKAGLKVGDILLKVDKDKVGSVEAVIKKLSTKEVGDQVKIQYLRNGEIESVTATLQKRSEPAIYKYYDVDKLNKEYKKQIYNYKYDKDKLKKELKHKKRHTDTRSSGNVEDKDSEMKMEYFVSYPNPSQGKLNIKFSGKAVPTELKINDMAGAEVYSKQIPDFDGKMETEVDLSNAPKGTLIVFIRQGEKIISQKVLLN